MKKRLNFIDELRGLLIILVCLYHFGYDLIAFCGLPMDWFWNDWPVQGGRDIITGSLIIISGISCSLSSNNLKRGAKTFAVAMLLSLITYLIMPSETIVFGILHFFGICMLLWGLVGRYIKIPVKIGIPICALLFTLLRFLSQGVLLIPFIGYRPLPTALYQSRFLFWLGLPHASFFSADYYPILPWGVLFLAGGILGSSWKKAAFPTWFYPSRIPALSLLGRHTLIIYLVHQPLFIGILLLAVKFTTNS